MAIKYQNSSAEVSRFKREAITINYQINDKPLEVYLREQLAVRANENISSFLNVLRISQSFSTRDFGHTEITQPLHNRSVRR